MTISLTAEEAFEAREDEFRRLLLPDSAVTRLATGLRFTEGPVWMPPEQCLLFSDIPADTIYQWAGGDEAAVWRQPSRHANGNTLDRQGRLVTCEHGSRTVTRTEPDGTVTTLAESYRGKRLNSPNDVVVKSDGTIWFTDPPYGIKPDQSEQPANYVFRLDPGAAEPVVVAEDFSRPNGLCFSPDERTLYIANSDTAIHHVRRFRVTDVNTLEGGEVFAVITPGVPDGMRCDSEGRLFCTAGDGVHVLSPQGRLLGIIHTPKTAANCAFGGADRSTLFITASDSIWAVEMDVKGL